MIFFLRRLIIVLVLAIVDRIARTTVAVHEPRTLLLLRPDALGDYILFRPFLRSIRESERFRGFRIVLVGNIVWRDLSEALDRETVDEFIWLDRKKLGSELRYRYRFIRALSARRVGAVIYPAFSRDFTLGDMLVNAVPAAVSVGSCGDLNNVQLWEKRFGDRIYTDLFPGRSGLLFEFLRNREFMAALLPGEALPAQPKLQVPDATPPLVLPERYVVVVPGAGDSRRCWPVERFVKVMHHLAEVHGLQAVVTGAKQEASLAAEMKKSHDAPAFLDLAGFLELPQVAKVIAGAVAIVSNETGIVHMAAALSIPFVCISNGHHFGRFHPYPPSLGVRGTYVYPPDVASRLRDPRDLEDTFGKGVHGNIMAVEVADVTAALDALVGSI